MRLVSCLLVCVGLLSFAGCGDGITLYPVSGTVTLDGKPVEGLMVAFAPEDSGFSGAGRTDANGKYTITSTKGKGLPSGNYNVAISEVTVVENSGSEVEEAAQSSNNASYERMAMGGGSQQQYRDAEKKKSKLIPAKYNAQSTLKEIVAETENTIDFALSSK